MSVTIDINVLVYASNEADDRRFVARELLDRLASGPDLVYLFWPTILGYLRVVTHPSILPRPLNFRSAVANIAKLIRRPHILAVGESPGFWETFLDTAGNTIRGNVISDAHVVALMRQHGVAIIYTWDRDFRRFEGVSARVPSQ